MSRRVYLTGVGPVSGLGLGIEPNWTGLTEGGSAIGPVKAFDASAMGCPIAAEVPEDFKVRNFVPKTYRKATKVMARDIELAVAAADLAARDAGLVTKGTDPDSDPSYAPDRMGCHIGAGLIAADLDELTAALVTSAGESGKDFDIHHWGQEGMEKLTPLWLLKYLPNMLACHVTIIHDTHGPSNTITCGEASGGLSVGESLRVIQRGQADLCFCGGAESKLNPMAYLRQVMTGRLVNDADSTDPTNAVRPFDQNAKGGVLGEGGGIVTLECVDAFEERGGDPANIYAEVLGFGASQTVNPATRNRTPDAEGRGIVSAARAALREAGLDTDAVDVVIPFGLGHAEWDGPEAAALRTLLGDRLPSVPVLAPKASVGNLGAGSGGFDLCVAAKVLKEQQLPATLNRDHPIDGLGATSADKLDVALVFATGLGGQNTAIVLKKV
ncbi:beta-ketoacyl-[acyl-carrier-protein] synthase family protein [Algisphaera agarilytica]|uniref:3-oxoacyl-[acyl-carrier-protein] synthase II n=1 Tax=Algisphaera agarilytica TaxID=1385975 RepID=A0A7X0H4S6_9BACT|nr:beta-ketoacyl synthase [Algisphaera agarilytica]MBB6429278.1 3-oxoacyl-[acyl-carrier-protein] synthase II [Algisphaera agarilytica]